MLETKDLILGKARFSDWEAMYRNVWSRPESARYMSWCLTTGAEKAQARIRRTIEFQKTHDTYLVYLKATGLAIGFAGVEPMEPDACSEAGICLGPDFVGRGYGTQLLRRLMRHAAEAYGAKLFYCFARENNAASNALILSQGFTLVSSEEKTDVRDGSTYALLKYSRRLEPAAPDSVRRHT